VLLVYDAGPGCMDVALRHSLTPFSLPMCHFELPFGSHNQLTILCCYGNRCVGRFPGGLSPLNALISVSGWFVYWLDGSWQGFWLLEIGIFANSRQGATISDGVRKKR